MKRWQQAAAAVLLSAAAGGPALADNQTPTTTPVRFADEGLSYQIQLKRVDTPTTLPTLQSFVSAEHGGLWVLIGGRTNGLHKFTSDPLKNFPPSDQNRRIWVIDPTTWKVWSRPLGDSKLTKDQIDGLAATAMEGTQVGDVLYIVGGYGYSHSKKNFTTFSTLTAVNVPDLIDWVRREDVWSKPKAPDLADMIRQTSNDVLRITGGQMTVLDGRTILAFGQDFEGGYGDPDFKQTYSGQIRSFKIDDNGTKVRISAIDRKPSRPDYKNFRRRDLNFGTFIDTTGDKRKDKAVVLGGVFTTSGGINTVPVEIDASGKPHQDDPSAKSTFKQGMNGYNAASLGLFFNRSGATHTVLFGGISYVVYRPNKDAFVEDTNFPFTSQVTAVTRSSDGNYRQYLFAKGFPVVKDKGGASLLFGAEATMFLKPSVPTTGVGLVDADKLGAKSGKSVSLGWVFGGIAAEKPNFGKTVASNEVFEVLYVPN